MIRKLLTALRGSRPCHALMDGKEVGVFDSWRAARAFIRKERAIDRLWLQRRAYAIKASPRLPAPWGQGMVTG